MVKKNRTVNLQLAFIIIVLLINWIVNPHIYPVSAISLSGFATCHRWQAERYGTSCNPEESYGEAGYLYWLIDTEAYVPLKKTPVISVWKVGLKVDDYGIVDLAHATGSYDITDQIFCGIQMAMNQGQNSIFLRWQGLEIRYLLNMERLVDDETVNSVAYGIFQDFSVRFEKYQAKQGLPRSLSAFSKEDLPGNYIGFYAYVHYRNKDKSAAIAATIDQLARYNDENYTAVNVFQNPFGRKNYEWNFIDCDEQGCSTIPWSNTMQIKPILESPTSWQALPTVHSVSTTSK